MATSVEEDFSDVAEFVQEDTSYVEDHTSEDELERKIAEEHAKYKEAQAKRQEEVRANRPWSAPPVESPRPEHQKEREKERKARASDAVVEGPRAEYEPPARPYLLPAQASGGNMSYMSRPQSAEHRTGRVSSNGNRPAPPASLSGIEEETGDAATSTTSQRASEAGRLSSTLTGAGVPDDVPAVRDQYGSILENDGEAEDAGDVDDVAAGAAGVTAAGERDGLATVASAPVETVESLAVALADNILGLGVGAGGEGGGEEPSPGGPGEATDDGAAGPAAAEEESSAPADAADEADGLQSARPSGDVVGEDEDASRHLLYGQSDPADGGVDGSAVEEDTDGAGVPKEEQEEEVEEGEQEPAGYDSYGLGPVASGAGQEDSGPAGGSEPGYGGSVDAGDARDSMSESLREQQPDAGFDGVGGGDGGDGGDGAVEEGGEGGEPEPDGNEQEEEEEEVIDAARAEAEAEEAEREHEDGGSPDQAAAEEDQGGEEGDGEGAEGGSEQAGASWRDEDTAFGAYGREYGEYGSAQPPSAAANDAPPSLAMRGFVEPLPYESSYGAAGEAGRSPSERESGDTGLAAAEMGTEDGGEEHGGDSAAASRAPEAGEDGGGDEEMAAEAERTDGGEESPKAAAEQADDDNYEDDYEESFESESEDKTRSGDMGGSAYMGHSARQSRQSAPSREPSAPALPSHEPSAPPQPPSREPSAPPQPPSHEPSAPPQPPSREPSAPPQPPSREPSAPPQPPSREPSVPPQPPSREPSAPHLSQELSAPPPALSPEPSHHSRSSAGGAPPLLPPLSTSNSVTAMPPLRSRPSLSATAAAAAAPDDADDDQVHRRAAAATSFRGSSNGGAGSAAASSALELLPPQQFAMQLLKHDIEVLPQHHKAAAEAAAARRKPSSARPAGAGLAAFGYLGYHLVAEELTAPSGPVFRGTSPGRSQSPGRASTGGATAAAGLVASSSLKARDSDGGAAAAAAGRPVSAPHMRPDGPRPDSPDAVAERDGSVPSPPTALGQQGQFIGVARDMRVGWLPPVAPQRAGRGSSGGSGGGARPGPGPLEGGAASTQPTERSLSVLDEEEAETATQSRMKFDVWLDALSGGGSAAAAAGLSAAKADPDVGVKHPTGSLANINGGDAAAVRRQARPMTAPAHGIRRPMSARVGAGVYGVQAPPSAAPQPLGGRPMSAQPHHLRPASASRRTGGGGNEHSLADPPVPVTVPPQDAAAAGAGGTAAVDVAGITVSVYVADTLKRIVEANRWLQQMGVTTKRYRLKDRFSSLAVQLCEELPPLASEQHQQQEHPAIGGGSGAVPYDSGVVAVVKELTLKQFLSGHAKLRQQARKMRNAAAVPPLAHSAGQAAVPPLPANGSQGPAAGAAGRSRPFSAGPAGRTSVGPAPGGGRVRPASAMPHSGGAYLGAPMTSAGGAGLSPYAGGGAAAGAAAVGPRPARPSSANPAYGRTPLFNVYGSSSSPPGAGGASGPFTGLGSYSGGGAAAAAGRLPAPRAAWGATGGSGGAAAPAALHAHAPGGAGGAANGYSPYMYHRSMSAAPRTSVGILDEEDTEAGKLVLEVDERGDVSRALRQQLGGAADYCQAKRNEIARLRNMPLL